MNVKLNCDSKKILNKKFDTKINGYDPNEVDEFLDKILADYLYYENEIKNNINNLSFKNSVIKDKDEKIKILETEKKNLISQIKNFSNPKIDNSEIIKRIAKLEENSID